MAQLQSYQHPTHTSAVYSVTNKHLKHYTARATVPTNDIQDVAVFPSPKISHPYSCNTNQLPLKCFHKLWIMFLPM